MFLAIVLFYTVTVLPDVVGQDVTPNNITVGYLGHGATLHCQEGRPPFDWWYQTSPADAVQQVGMNGAVVTSYSDRFSIYQSKPSELVISGVQYRDAGLYTCIEQAGLGPARYVVQLDVIDSIASPSEKPVDDTVVTTDATGEIANGSLSPGAVAGIVILVIVIISIIAIGVFILIYVLLKRRKDEDMSLRNFRADLRGCFGLLGQQVETNMDEESVPMNTAVDSRCEEQMLNNTPDKQKKIPKQAKRSRIPPITWPNVAQVRREFAPKSKIDPTINNVLPERVINVVLDKTLVPLVTKLLNTTPRADIKAVTTLVSMCQMWRRLVISQRRYKYRIRRHMNSVCAPYCRTAPNTASCLNLSKQVVGVARRNNIIYVACQSSNVIHLFAATPPHSVLQAPIIKLETTEISDIVAWRALNAIIVGDLKGGRIIKVNEKGKSETWHSPGKLTDEQVKNAAPCSLLTSDNKLIVVTKDKVLKVYGIDKKKLFKVQLDDKVDPFNAILAPSFNATLSIYIRTVDDRKIVAVNPPTTKDIECTLTGVRSPVHAVFDNENRGFWCYANNIFLAPCDARKKRMLLDHEYGGLSKPRKLCLVDESRSLMVCDGRQVNIFDLVSTSVKNSNIKRLQSTSNQPHLSYEAVKGNRKKDASSLSPHTAKVDIDANPAKVNSESKPPNAVACLKIDSKHDTRAPVPVDIASQRPSTCTQQSNAPVAADTTDSRFSVEKTAASVTNQNKPVPVSLPATSDKSVEMAGVGNESQAKKNKKAGKTEGLGTHQKSKKEKDEKARQNSKSAVAPPVLPTGTNTEMAAEIRKTEAEKHKGGTKSTPPACSSPSMDCTHNDTTKEQRPEIGLQDINPTAAEFYKAKAESSENENKSASRSLDHSTRSQTSPNSTITDSKQNRCDQVKPSHPQESSQQPPTSKDPRLTNGSDITAAGKDVVKSQSVSQQPPESTNEGDKQGARSAEPAATNKTMTAVVAENANLATNGGNSQSHTGVPTSLGLHPQYFEASV